MELNGIRPLDAAQWAYSFHAILVCKGCVSIVLWNLMWNLNGYLRREVVQSIFHISVTLCQRDQRKWEDQDTDLGPRGFIPNWNLGSPWQSKVLRSFRMCKTGPPDIPVERMRSQLIPQRKSFESHPRGGEQHWSQKMQPRLLCGETVNAHEERWLAWAPTGKKIAPTVLLKHLTYTLMALTWYDPDKDWLPGLRSYVKEVMEQARGAGEGGAHCFRTKWSRSSLASPWICHRDPYLGLISPPAARPRAGSGGACPLRCFPQPQILVGKHPLAPRGAGWSLCPSLTEPDVGMWASVFLIGACLRRCPSNLGKLGAIS